MAGAVSVSARFDDREATRSAFSDEFLVHCPRCDSCAKVLRLPSSGRADMFAPRRFLCSACGYVKDAETTGVVQGRNRDWYFGLALWLQVPCCGETLWAHNEAHLDYLECFVRATLREERPSTLASRLPSWMKSAKNRDEVLKCIGRLRARLAER
jgi:hypothetical protein